MIMINGNWEQVKNPADVVRVCDEYIGHEFAQKVEKIFKDREKEVRELERNLIDDGR